MRSVGLMVMLLGAAGLCACDARLLVGRDGSAAVTPDDAGAIGDGGGRYVSDANDAVAQSDAPWSGPRLVLQPVEFWNNGFLYPCNCQKYSLPYDTRHVRVALLGEGLTIVRSVVCTDDSLDLGRVPPGSYLLAAASNNYNLWPIPNACFGPVYTVGIRAAPYLHPTSMCLSTTQPYLECDPVPVEVSPDAPTIVPLQLGCQGCYDACGGG